MRLDTRASMGSTSASGISKRGSDCGVGPSMRTRDIDQGRIV